MNCDIDKFSTNVRKITESNFLGYFGQFVVCLNSLWIARIVCGSSGQFVDCPDSLWIVRTVSELSGQFLDCPDSFWIVQRVFG